MPPASADGKIHLEKADIDGIFHDPETGFPLLQNTRPEMVFGTGVLHSPLESGDNPIQGHSVTELQVTDEPDPFQVPLVQDINSKLIDDPDEELSALRRFVPEWSKNSVLLRLE